MRKTAEFSYEILAAALIIIFTVLLCAEYLWLYVLSKKNEETDIQKREINSRIHAMTEAFLYSPTASSRETELTSLIEYIGDDPLKRDEASVQLIQLIKRSEDIPPEKLASLGRLYESLNPIEFYSKQLESGNYYEKSYAVRRLADFNASDKTEEIRKLLDDKHADVVYNAAMALSELGDMESVLVFARKCENNRYYSHRVLLELFQAYSGDRAELVRRIFDERSDYIRATCIKAYTSDRIEALAPLYAEGVSSKDSNLKIACVKALAQLGSPDYEQKMITALNDKNWIVRLAAVAGLEKIASGRALEALVKAVRDEEWWVRNAAAKAIVNIDFQLVYVEKVLSGYDKYAADAVKNALYKQINMNGGGFR